MTSGYVLFAFYVPKEKSMADTLPIKLVPENGRFILRMVLSWVLCKFGESKTQMDRNTRKACNVFLKSKDKFCDFAETWAPRYAITLDCRTMVDLFRVKLCSVW